MKHHIFLKVLSLCLLLGGSGKDCWGQERTTTKEFTINEQTGEVTNCNLIKLVGKDRNAQKLINQVDIKIQKSLNKKIKKKGDCLFTMATSNKKHFICLDKSHGDYVNALYFFDSKLKLINKYIFDEPKIIYVHFNDLETFLCVSEQFNGDFYFFTTSGKLKHSGNFNQLTGDKGTSYGHNNISKNGNVWLLRNNETWIYANDDLIGKIKIGSINTKIDEKNSKIFYLAEDKIHIYNYQTRKIEYISEKISNLSGGYFENGKLFLSLLNEKKYEYNIEQ